MSASINAGPKLLGMFELDAANTVIYSRPEGFGAEDTPPAPGICGLNLFDAGAPLSNADELRRRIDAFRAGAAPADCFYFNCRYEDGTLPVRVLLARMRKPEDTGSATSVLIHVRARR